MKNYFESDWVHTKGKRLFFDEIYFKKALIFYGVIVLLFFTICCSDFMSHKKSNKKKHYTNRYSKGRLSHHRHY